MKTIEVTIVGTSPLLQNRFNASPPTSTRTIVQDHGTPREQAEKSVYRDGDHFYFPGSWISGAIREAGGNHKLVGSRKSAKYLQLFA
jgi:hypothetical protein